MPVYKYECSNCGHTDSFYHTFDEISEKPVHYCLHPDKKMVVMERLYNFSYFKKSMQAHFNTSVGKVVNTEREFKDDLARKSDEAAERLGMPTNFQPIDPNDKQTLGVTDEGLDTTYDADVAAGKQESKKWY